MVQLCNLFNSPSNWLQCIVFEALVNCCKIVTKLLCAFYCSQWPIISYLIFCSYLFYRLFEFRKFVSNRDTCYNLIPRDYPVQITRVSTRICGLCTWNWINTLYYSEGRKNVWLCANWWRISHTDGIIFARRCATWIEEIIFSISVTPEMERWKI